MREKRQQHRSAFVANIPSSAAPDDDGDREARTEELAEPEPAIVSVEGGEGKRTAPLGGEAHARPSSVADSANDDGGGGAAASSPRDADGDAAKKLRASLGWSDAGEDNDDDDAAASDCAEDVAAERAADGADHGDLAARMRAKRQQHRAAFVSGLP